MKTIPPRPEGINELSADGEPPMPSENTRSMANGAGTSEAKGDDKRPDPFDPERLAIKGDPAAGIGVKRMLAHVAVRKPSRQEFFRVHPGPAFSKVMAILDLKTDGEVYLVAPEVAEALPGETRLVMLTACINRQGTVFLYPVPLPTPNTRQLGWHMTAREAVECAVTSWVRMVANMPSGAYDIYVAPASIGEPEWPDHSFRDLLRVAFGGGRLIEDIDHPILKQLLGRE